MVLDPAGVRNIAAEQAIENVIGNKPALFNPPEPRVVLIYADLHLHNNLSRLVQIITACLLIWLAIEAPAHILNVIPTLFSSGVVNRA